MSSITPLAQLQIANGLGERYGTAAIAAALAFAVIFGLLILFVSRYRRCPANKILVISGSVGGGNAAKCVSGGGAFVWPVIQEYAYLSLEPIKMDIPLNDALSLENIRISVPAVFTVAIGTDVEVRQNAAMRLLGMAQKQIEESAHDIIVGQLRQVIASMRIDEINRDRDGFLHKVQHQLEPELKKIGLMLLNVNIKDLKDGAGYLDALGKQAAQQAIQTARGDVAEQEKIGEIRVAQANREKITAVAEAEAQREIALRETQRERATKIAQLDKDQQIAEQTAAFEREAEVAAADQKKRISLAQANATAVAGEAEAQARREAEVATADQKRRVALAEANATAVAGEADAQARVAATSSALQVKQAEAYLTAETKKREAEAAVSEAQNRALARAALAEAARVEAEKRALLEAPAKAEKARRIVDAEAAAETVRLAAEADANAVRVRLEAQARGEAAIIEQRAEALGKLIDRAGGAREAFLLLLQEQIPQLAETAAKAISGIKIDKVVVWEGGNGVANGVGNGSTANFIQSMARSLPPMMDVLQSVAGVELPSYLGKQVADTPPVAVPNDVTTPGSAVAATSEAAKS
jgi:flotillin